MFHWKILSCTHDDRLWLWRFTLPPKHKCWRDLELLWDHRLQGEHRGDIRWVVGFHRHGFDLGTGALANVKGRRDLTFLSRRHFLLLSLSHCAAARSADRFKSHRLVARILVFEMAYRLLVRSGGT